jgi:hypothetical protein
MRRYGGRFSDWQGGAQRRRLGARVGYWSLKERVERVGGPLLKCVLGRGWRRIGGLSAAF